ncbi:MAG: transglutaminase domain-containing protein [Lachnospiraceae bacterium]|nr:transglutaminase domain-containing protein [Lachnospiraceae bacterium]
MQRGEKKNRRILLLLLTAALLAQVFRPIKVLAAPVTVYNGTDYAAVYDYSFYINRYADLKAAFGTDEAAALKHFVTNGMKEGRQAKADFNVQAYAARYADLQKAFGNDLSAYYRHFIGYGQKEGRSGAGGGGATPAVPASQTDLPKEEGGITLAPANAQQEIILEEGPAQTANHVLHGTDYSAVFDATYYANRYADLKNAFGNNAEKLLQHYIQHGYREGRIAKAGVSQDTLKHVMESHTQARAKLDEVGWDLRKAFDWCLTIHHNREIVTPDLGTRAMANIGFTTGRGSCYVMAACFYEMAIELGYDAHQISGYVPRNDGTKSPHSWVEINHSDGVTRVYDVSTYKNYKINTYAFTYGTKGTWRYIDYFKMN